MVLRVVEVAFVSAVAVVAAVAVAAGPANVAAAVAVARTAVGGRSEAVAALAAVAAPGELVVQLVIALSEASPELDPASDQVQAEDSPADPAVFAAGAASSLD